MLFYHIGRCFIKVAKSTRRYAIIIAEIGRFLPKRIIPLKMEERLMILFQSDLDKISEGQLEGFFVGWARPLTPEQHLHILKNSHYRVLALDKESKKVVGFVNALCDGVNFAFIPMLEVLPSFQNRGIGTRLMEIMLKELEPYSCVDLTCDEQMQGFYQRFSMLKSHGMVLRKYLKHQKEIGQ